MTDEKNTTNLVMKWFVKRECYREGALCMRH